MRIQSPRPIIVFIAAMVQGIVAFAPSHNQIISLHASNTLTRTIKSPVIDPPRHQINLQKYSRTALQMGYQLPPSPKGPLDDLKSILPTIGTGILVAMFFASPLGAAFFAIFNSLFVLALLTPFILFVGFQIWSSLYTLKAPCPSCGQIPVVALKSGEPTVCINCGAYSRVNEAGNGLELCNNPNDMMNSGSLFDSLFGGGPMGGMSDFGVSSSVPSDEEKKKVKRQGTIIDVEVERD